MPECHAVRARGFAGPADQAQVQVLTQAVVGGNAPLDRAADQRDAPARRVGFAQGLAIGRALRHAQTARDTAAGLGQDPRSRCFDVRGCRICAGQTRAVVNPRPG